MPLRLAKIIIREDFPPDTYVDEAGVYVLIRADDWMAGWLDREPWTRVDLEQTIRIISVLFYGFRLGGRDDLDEIAAAIAAVVLEFPPEKAEGPAAWPDPPLNFRLSPKTQMSPIDGDRLSVVTTRPTTPSFSLVTAAAASLHGA